MSRRKLTPEEKLAAKEKRKAYQKELMRKRRGSNKKDDVVELDTTFTPDKDYLEASESSSSSETEIDLTPEKLEDDAVSAEALQQESKLEQQPTIKEEIITIKDEVVEVKDLFQKPKPKCAIVIAHLREDEKWKEITRHSITTTFPEAEQIWVEDINEEGCGRTRHKGIMIAKEQGFHSVILIDAHMRFAPDTLRKMFEYTVEHDNTLVGCYCYHNDECDFKGTVYKGAKFTLFNEYNEKFVSLSAQWFDGEGEQNAVMGACYAFSINRYLLMGQPLKLLQSWGCDEEYLSACNYFSGGKIKILPLECAHLFRKKGTTQDEQIYVKLWANRFNLINILPLSQEKKVEFRKWMFRTNAINVENWNKINVFINKVSDEVKHINNILSNYNMSEEVFINGCKKRAKDNKSMATPKTIDNPAIFKKEENKVDKIDKVNNLIKSIAPIPKTLPKPPMQTIQNYIPCRCCKGKLPILKVGKPNQQRVIVCLKCNTINRF